MADGPAFQRLGIDERRGQLLELGERLFTTHAYSELSMARIAREAGISKALLYHYFPSKQAYFEATLRNAAGELRSRTEPDPSLQPADQLRGSLGAYLSWIEQHREAYVKLLRTAGEVAAVRALVEEERGRTAQRILDGLGGATPRRRAAVRGWLWFVDGACLDWIEHGDVGRDELRELLLGTLLGAIGAADA